MGDKEIDGYIEDYDRDIEGINGYIEDIEGFKFWWEDYDGDIEEERREIEERVSKIENPEERKDRYEQLLNALEYDEYFACNPHFKCKNYLMNVRTFLRGCENENIDEFINLILRYTNMERTVRPCMQNILIVNGNRKFTFLNISKIDTGDKLDWEKILEKGKTKLRREYLRTWEEGNDDNENKFKVVFIR